MKVTLARYYKGFGSLYALWAGLPFLPPLLHACVPDSSAFAEYLFPPLGDSQRLAFAATIGTLLLTTFVAFVCCQMTQGIRPSVPAMLMAGWLLGFCALISLYVPYVRHVAVPSVKLEVPVSIGFERTDFALRTYPGWNDWEMLHDRGPWEEQIHVLWTQRSIIVVRALLWVTYSLTLSCFLSIASLAVYQHAAEEAESELKPN